MEMLIMGRAPMIYNPFCINTETHAETHGNAVNGASPMLMGRAPRIIIYLTMI